ncbi:hypothetical protein [Microbacterium sp. UBA3486]|uniref:hypothetical protein n=1 Tax=Microbacterium TaxID=33882 RepID=UPI0025F645D5|nr:MULTISPECIES: hypothetical protein [Microbacterium]
MTGATGGRPLLQRLDAAADVLAGAILAYLIVVPVGHNGLLVALLLLLGIWSVWRVARHPRRLPPLLLAAACCAAVAILIGVIGGAGNPGFVHSLISWVAAPVLFWAWASQMDERVLGLFLRFAVWATLFLASIVLALWAMGAVGVEPAVWIKVLVDADVSGSWPNVIVGVYGASSLIAVAPLWIVGMFFHGHALPSRKLMAAAAVLATVAAVVSTRRAALALGLLVPILMFLAYLAVVGRTWFTRRHIRALIIVAGGAVLAAGAVLITPTGQRMSAGVLALLTGRGGTADEDLRIEQVGRLWSAFLESPVFGHGIGAVIPGYARSAERPWNFEMQYNMLLFQVGVVGVLFLAASAVLVVCAAVRVVTRRPEARPAVFTTAAGAFAVLAANALNPLLQAPGHFWAVFLFVGAVVAFGTTPVRVTGPVAESVASGDGATVRAD